MDSAASSAISPEVVAKTQRAGLARWKLESLTGLLGFKSLKNHQRESEKNQSAENAYVRRVMWGDQIAKTTPSAGDDMGDRFILGDVTHPAPVIITGQQQGSGIGKVLAGAALAAGLIGIPGAGLAGYFLSKLTDKPAATQPGTDDTVDIGLKRFSELVGGTK